MKQSHKKRGWTAIVQAVLFLCILSVSGCVRYGGREDRNGQPNPSEGASGVVTEAISPPNVLGIVVNEQFEVLHVEPWSGAEEAGILKGDIIQEINSIPIAENTQRIKQIIWYAAEGEVVKVFVVRQGEDLFVDVVPRPQPPGTSEDDKIPLTPTPVFSPLDYF